MVETTDTKVSFPCLSTFLNFSCSGKRRSRSRSRRSRSDSRSRSSRRDKASGSGSGSAKYSGGGKRGKSYHSHKKSGKDKSKSDDKPVEKDADKQKSTKSSKDFSSPSTFDEAWGTSFFLASAVLLITSLGFIVDTIPLLNKLPLGGRLKHCIQNWRKVCNNDWVLDVVSSGYKLPFRYTPVQHFVPKNPQVSGAAHDILVTEASDLLIKEAIASVDPVSGQFLSSYFAVPKPRSPGKFRPILNLKRFNKNIKKYKFRMEGLKQVRDWIQQDAWFCGMDLKDAFLHIPINGLFWKFLRFEWLGSLLEWRVLPFGLKCSPRVITKVLKPVLAFLRTTWGILISIYIDDILLQGCSPDQVYLHAQVTALFLMVLGWSLQWKKSDFIPKQQTVHLGFVLDSVSMTVSCPQDKILRLQSMCKNVMKSGVVTVHDAERILGTMESVRPVTPLCALRYRSFQKQLLRAKSVSRRPKQIIYLSSKSISSLAWWVSPAGFAGNASAPIRELAPTVEVWTDANLIRGGGHNSRGDFIQRHWTENDLANDASINLLETRAARESILALTEPGDRVRLHIDNRTAAAYIRCQGGTKSNVLSQEARLLWEQTVSQDVSLLTPHWIPTGENTAADFLSRNDIGQWMFMLKRDMFKSIMDHFNLYPTLDAFACHWSAQLPRYMSWHRDPQAVAQDALLSPWDPVTFLFPPVPLLPKVVRKIKDQKIRAILVCPKWPTALWWGLLVGMMVEPPMVLPYYRTVLQTQDNSPVEPYLDPLVALHVSGRNFL